MRIHYHYLRPTLYFFHMEKTLQKMHFFLLSVVKASEPLKIRGFEALSD